VSRRAAWFAPIAAMGLVWITSAPVMAGGAATCPTGSISSSAFASANLGSVARICGTVTTGANSVTTAIPTGAPGFTVESWLGVSLNIPGFSGQSASVLQFTNFQATQGSVIDFNWITSYEQLTEGYSFALLDGQFTVLDQNFLVPLSVSSILNSTQLSIGSDGFHTLSLGMVDGCTSCLGLNANALDPQATFSNITLTDVSATPEPTTLSLIALGLAGVAFGAIRRKRQ